MLLSPFRKLKPRSLTTADAKMSENGFRRWTGKVVPPFLEEGREIRHYPNGSDEDPTEYRRGHRSSWDVASWGPDFSACFYTVEKGPKAFPHRYTGARMS